MWPPRSVFEDSAVLAGAHWRIRSHSRLSNAVYGRRRLREQLFVQHRQANATTNIRLNDSG